MRGADVSAKIQIPNSKYQDGEKFKTQVPNTKEEKSTP